MSQTRHWTALLSMLAVIALAGLRASGATSTLVAAGSVWKYLDTGANLGTGWRTNSFNDAAWASGPAPLGYGEMNVGNSSGCRRHESLETNPTEFNNAEKIYEP